MKSCLFLFLLLLVSCAAALTPSPSLRLEFGEGGCSGTVIAPKIVLTAEHCLGAGPLSTVNGIETHATRVLRDGQDHVMVWTDRVVGHGRVRLAEPEVGQRVHWIGNPSGFEGPTYREGYVAALESQGAIVDAQGFFGDSGSGVFDDSGRLVGVISAGRRYENGLAIQMMVMRPLKFTPDDWKAVR